MIVGERNAKQKRGWDEIMHWFWSVLTCCLVALPAAADNFGLMRVVNLPTNDSLNIRQGSSTSHSVIGNLRDGVIVDSFGTDESGRWTRIAVGETTGWVASRFLEPRPMVFSQSNIPRGMQCVGTEPFWNYYFAGHADEGTLSRLGVTGPAEPVEEELFFATPSSNRGMHVLSIEGAFHRSLLIFERCSDGMSDRLYPWSIHLQETGDGGGWLGSGCCTAAPDRPN